jgi:hypothetical protein
MEMQLNKMRGLCHGCYASNLEIKELVRGAPYCLDCAIKEKLKEELLK